MWYRIKGFHEVTYIASAWAPLSKASIHSSKIFNNCETVGLSGKKPNCLSDRAFVFLRNSSKVSLINGFIILQVVLVRLIGR